MSTVIAAVRSVAMNDPRRPALHGDTDSLDYGSLHTAVHRLACALSQTGLRTFALLADNGLSWAVADLAALAAGLRLVPLPLFFSPRQMLHALRDAAVEGLLVEPSITLPDLVKASPPEALKSSASIGLELRRLPTGAPARIPTATQKITYTSGTTGASKGVCLDAALLEQQAEALRQISAAHVADAHLCALPLPTLLENVAGLYLPLLAGAQAHLPRLAVTGPSAGPPGFDPHRLLNQVSTRRATSLILVPQMLQGLVVAIEAGAEVPRTLRFVAVGGAPISPRLLERAERAGLPVYEGYGLSECGSVVALNTPAARRIGSVGKPIPGVRVSFSETRGIRVSGRAFLGYTGDSPRASGAIVDTGDLGHLDADGFLHVDGRSKDMFITAYGRNVSPEWIERELCLAPGIRQAAVFGEAMPFNVAVIVSDADDAQIDIALGQVNAGLPDYARVWGWLRADEPFSPANAQLTPNGRLRRERISAAYRTRLSTFFENLHTA